MLLKFNRTRWFRSYVINNSINSLALEKLLKKYNPKKIVIFSRDEFKQYQFKNEINKKWSEYMEPIMKVDIDPITNFPYLLPLQMHLD